MKIFSSIGKARLVFLRVNGIETELIAACLQQNRKAQMALYEKYYKAMFNSAFRILKDHGLAEDVMQESFLSAYANLAQFRGEVAFGAWLRRIVINNSIQQYRKIQKRSEVNLESTPLPDPEAFSGMGTEDELQRRAKNALTALQSLPESYRVILNLNLIEGYDHEEICTILGITPANCRTTLSRAKAQLRKKLAPNGTYA